MMIKWNKYSLKERENQIYDAMIWSNFPNVLLPVSSFLQYRCNTIFAFLYRRKTKVNLLNVNFLPLSICPAPLTPNPSSPLPPPLPPSNPANPDHWIFLLVRSHSCSLSLLSHRLITALISTILSYPTPALSLLLLPLSWSPSLNPISPILAFYLSLYYPCSCSLLLPYPSLLSCPIPSLALTLTSAISTPVILIPISSYPVISRLYPCYSTLANCPLLLPSSCLAIVNACFPLPPPPACLSVSSPCLSTGGPPKLATMASPCPCVSSLVSIYRRLVPVCLSASTPFKLLFSFCRFSLSSLSYLLFSNHEQRQRKSNSFSLPHYPPPSYETQAPPPPQPTTSSHFSRYSKIPLIHVDKININTSKHINEHVNTSVNKQN